MTEQQYDPGEWGESARSAPPPSPAPQVQGPPRTQRLLIDKPFRTGIFLGFGFIVAWLIVSVVVFIIFAVLGVGLAGFTSGLGG